MHTQMDSRGWIPIALFVTFPRVRSLTPDPQLVTDVLSLSSLVEVHGQHVRTQQWQLFVLPTAQPSPVEEDDMQQHAHAGTHYDPTPAQQDDHGTISQNHDGEDDEEEEVEFVM